MKLDDYLARALKENINEKRMKWKHMGNANDNMADFLEELEENIPIIKSGEGKSETFEMKTMMKKIDKDWSKLWNYIVALAKKIEKNRVLYL